ncbi:MAG: sulfotransferase family protein [Acidimicrobiia bacterium]
MTDGLSDFGADGWQPGLDHLVAAAADLGDDADAITRIEGMILGRLVTRLRIEEWYRVHGTDAAHPVDGPVVIVGLPRTATTALHHLLGLDPRFRYPRTWEMANPLPPPDLATEQDDPRRPNRSNRGSDVRHISAPDGPTEDGTIYGLDFHNQELGQPVPTYTAWWRDADQRSGFAYHERVLRLLHSHRPPHFWLVKAPAYLFHLSQLVAQYPNARFVMTHRDPAQAIPSACSTIEAARQMLVPGWSAGPTFGTEILEHFLEGVHRAVEARDVLGQDRFIDVAQKDVEADAVASAERIYAFLGLVLADEVRAAMAQWALDNRRGSRGEHRYTPEDYGLTDEGIRDAFRSYTETYGDLCA